MFLAEDGPNPDAWSNATAAMDRYTYVAVKNAAVLPFTGVWVSNGGRSYPPWSGRHRGVVAIEECRVERSPGHAAALAARTIHRHGTTLALGGSVSVPYAFTEFPANAAEDAIASLAQGRGYYEAHRLSGAVARLGFDDTWLERGHIAS